MNDQEAICDYRHLTAWDKAAKGDAKWFKRHPERSYRVREPRKGELEFFRHGKELGGYPALILVRQIKPGVRIRRISYCSIPNEESFVRGWWNMSLDAANQGFKGEISISDFKAFLYGVPPDKRH